MGRCIRPLIPGRIILRPNRCCSELPVALSADAQDLYIPPVASTRHSKVSNRAHQTRPWAWSIKGFFLFGCGTGPSKLWARSIMWSIKVYLLVGPMQALDHTLHQTHPGCGLFHLSSGPGPSCGGIGPSKDTVWLWCWAIQVLHWPIQARDQPMDQALALNWSFQALDLVHRVGLAHQRVPSSCGAGPSQFWTGPSKLWTSAIQALDWFIQDLEQLHHVGLALQAYLCAPLSCGPGPSSVPLSCGPGPSSVALSCGPGPSSVPLSCGPGPSSVALSCGSAVGLVHPVYLSAVGLVHPVNRSAVGLVHPVNRSAVGLVHPVNLSVN
ncbi:hypothetical protein CBR_g10854 [Chara braunii]|uniref:Uncharacterized protein n=1 Tax=Chara braunii TaxID=69332 RepID=A0A388KPI6_CHABU|nr:hypothetical protein CBR_g10854 [Chara braunii]|eukprot:GBG71918.1 hypothetical protein CBR_g10854 [Chara braunii]